jgi:cytochrome P450
MATAAVAADITVDALERDPYPVYARLRREAPVCYVPAVNTWLATRWRDVDRMARRPAIFSAEAESSPVDRTFGKPTVLTTDGDLHRDLRRAMDPRFRPHAVAAYIDELVAPIAGEELAPLLGRGEAELMAEYFEPVSVRGLGRVLGLDVDAGTLRRWFAELAEGATNYEQDAAKQAIADRAGREIDERLAPLLARLEREPDESVVAHLLHAGMPAGRTRPRELVMPNLKVLLLGGMQEPGHGAGIVLFALLTHRDAARALLADPDAVLPRAIEEGLRWISPIGTQLRQVREPTALGGVRLEPGAQVAMCVASANRDEERFRDPDRFVLGRDDPAHAAFGFGEHFCVGHAFSRHLMRIALGRLLDAVGHRDLRLDPDRPPLLRGWEFRAPRHLHVQWKPA